MIQRRLARPLHKDDTQIREAFHIFKISIKLKNLFKTNKQKKDGGRGLTGTKYYV